MKNKKRGTVIVSALFGVLCLAQTASAFYAPNLQRWVNRDPVSDKGFFVASRPRYEMFRIKAKDYVFVANSPVDTIDPEGLWQVCCRAIRNDPNDSSTTRTGAGLFKHCDHRDTPCDSPNDESYPITRDPNCGKCQTDKQMSDCLKQNPTTAGDSTWGNNCQSSTLNALKKCCGKSEWKPDWYEYPPPNLSPGPAWPWPGAW